MAEGVAQADEFVLLTVFAKCTLKHGRMPGGFCYLGIDSVGRIKRPIYRQELSWDRNQELTVGRRYRFPPPHENIQTELPHSNEDVAVGPEINLLDEQPIDLYAALERLATEFPVWLFGGHMREGTYVVPGTNCPSVCVIKVNGRNLTQHKDKLRNDKMRVTIHINEEQYDFRYTGCEKLSLHDGDALVVLGLGRSWAPNLKTPKKCYILVLRIVQN